LDDLLVVELPKGSYALSFHVRETRSENLPLPPVAIDRAGRKTTDPPSIRGWAVAVVVLSTLLAAALITAAILISQRTKVQSAVSGHAGTKQEIFWNRFVTSPQPPWVIFSNGSFVGRPETGMRYFNAATDARSFILDHYTGVGEVLAIHHLDHLFGLFNRELRV